MFVDLTGPMTFFTSDLVISGVLAFLIGMVTMTVYSRVKAALVDRRYRADEAVVEAVVLEYTRRLRDYDKIIAELRSKIDIMEVRSEWTSQGAQTSQLQHASHHLQPHVGATGEVVTVTQQQQHPPLAAASRRVEVADVKEENNGTTDYILKLLGERPRTSREVQLAIGRTREHTSRLMKKLHDSGLVSRDANTKPFRYSITDAGRERLKERIPPPAV
ncbi:MAG TPA: helix-turn-helix domain-containing protein [Nitrososphaera sp.]|nr:helix-turn-helix domain-containing protein [Nitrososphaera sp.]